EILGNLRQAMRVAWIGESIAAVSLVRQTLVDVHPAAAHATHRLRQERGVQAVLLRDNLKGDAKCHCIVSSMQCVRVAKVDLMLPGSDFMVHCLDVDAKRRQCGYHAPPNA